MKTWSKEVLKRIISPTIEVPKRTMNAPAGVISWETPPQAVLPITPACPMVAKEIKKRMLPTTTFGWERGIFILESMKAKERKMKGRKIVAQEKEEIRKSLSLTKISPWRENEIKTKSAKAKKNIWVIEKTVCRFSLNLNARLVNLLLTFAITNTLYLTYARLGNLPKNL